MRILTVLFLTISVYSFASEKIHENHVKPTLEDGFDKTGLWIIGGGIAAMMIAKNYDYQHRDAWTNHQRMNESTSKIGDYLGTGMPGMAIALSQIFWLDRESGIAHGEALFDTFLVTSAIKLTSGRARPSSDNHHSMPSGHTSTTFATATSLTYVYGWKAALPGYLLAGFTAASRWADDAHWLSDTVTGAFIGFFWGRATSFHHQNAGGNKTRFLPMIDTKYIGLVWLTEF